MAMRTALMAGTLLTGSEPLNGFAGDRQVRAAAWPEHPAAGWGRVSIRCRDFWKIGFSGAATGYLPSKRIRILTIRFT